MARSGLHDALIDIPQPPCERGSFRCEHYDLCDREQMACGYFYNYVNAGTSNGIKKPTWEPSRAVYAMLFPMLVEITYDDRDELDRAWKLFWQRYKRHGDTHALRMTDVLAAQKQALACLRREATDG